MLRQIISTNVQQILSAVLIMFVVFLSGAAASPKLTPFATAEITLTGAVRVQAPPLPADALERVKSYFAARMSSRYMEQNCVSTTYPGWEGYPLQQCTYSVKGHHDPVRKTTKVILLDPSPEQLARWVVSTCVNVTGDAGLRCTRTLSRQIMGQSGAQFPVAGIVFEDILPENGVFEVFAFRNGVTVRVSGVTHLGTSQPTAAEIEKSLHGEVISALKFARIQSTTREQYRANGGTRVVAGLAWIEVIRDLYKAAWGNDRNELMIAWARDNADSLR
jgi:endoglucanase